MNMRIRLPISGGIDYEMNPAGPLPVIPGPPTRSRVAFAAAHVVAYTQKVNEDGPVLDLEATLAFRRYLWSLGFRVAEAMDTAQRGMGLSWESAKELIRHSCAEAKAVGGGIACGANTDQLSAAESETLETVCAAYWEQCAWIEDCGGQVILMASRALAKAAATPEDYRRVYDRVLGQLSRPAILHWLGEAFDPQLSGYWGGRDAEESMQILLEIIREHAGRIEGVKISLLDEEREIRMRRLLPENVRMYTGDDFNYPRLIRGDEHGHSDALLGIFDGIAPAAALALRALDAGKLDEYEELLAPTLPLSRHIFAKPTFHYKTGLTFLAYLNGHQKHFRMVGGFESARTVSHLAELFVLADRARLLRYPELAAERMSAYLSESVHA